VAALLGLFVLSLAIYPILGLAFFPQTDAGQFTINVKVPTGTRIEITNQYVAKIEDLIRHVVEPHDMKMIVSNIGVVNDCSSLYTTNAGEYTATIQTALNDDHHESSLTYMNRVRDELAAKFPDVRAFFQSGSMVDAILNSGMPAPIDVQVNTRDLDVTYNTAQELARRIRKLPGVGQIYIPQDMNYPALKLNVDRVHAAELGLSQKDIVDNVITALNSNTMIAPNYWVDYKTGNDYFSDSAILRARQTGHPQSGGLERDPTARAQSETADHTGFGGEAGKRRLADRGGPLPDPTHRGHLRHAVRRRPG
jgi:multidrug efflux pump subunit AcrB